MSDVTQILIAIQNGEAQKGEEARIVRATIYSRNRHVLTMAVDDKGRFVPGAQPPKLDAVATAFDDNGAPVMTSGHDLPRVYDGIYRAALSYGMSADMVGLVVKLLASNVDFQAQLRAANLKRRALADRSDRPVRFVLAVPDTVRNRRHLASVDELLRRALPLRSKSVWAAIRGGQPLGGDGVLVLRRLPGPVVSFESSCRPVSASRSVAVHVVDVT